MGSNPFPDISEQLQPNAQVAPQPEPGGRLRSLLSNFFQGAGGAMMKQVGLPTPQEQAQRQIQNQQAAQELESQNQLRQAQIQGIQSEMQPVQLPGMPTIAAKHAAAVMGAFLASQSRQKVGEDANKTRLTIAELIAKSKADNPPKPGSIEQQLLDAIGSDDIDKVRKISQVVDITRTQPGVARFRAGAQARAENTKFGTVIEGTNIPTTISVAQAIKTGAPEVSTSALGKLGGAYAVFKDAHGLMDAIDKDADGVNLSDPAVSARLAAGYAAMTEPASKGLVGQVGGYLARSSVNNQLSPPERQLLIHMGQLKAASTGFRSITGQAGVSEFQQRLDAALVPGPGAAASKEALKQQTKELRGFLGRFAVAQPEVGLNAPNQPNNLRSIGGGDSGPPPGATHTGVSRIDGKKYYLDANGNKLGVAP